MSYHVTYAPPTICFLLILLWSRSPLPRARPIECDWGLWVSECLKTKGNSLATKSTLVSPPEEEREKRKGGGATHPPTNVDGRSVNRDIALAALDAQIGKSELLMSVAPIRLMSVGGFVSVKLFQNRNSTIDVDCLMDPNFDAVHEYRSEFWKAVRQVGVTLHHETDWLNDELRNFIQSSKRQDLFLESVEQDIIMYRGKNLKIFAGKMEWALERKIRRIANAHRPRLKDIDDAVAVTRFIIEDCGGPLSEDYVEKLNRNGFDVANMRKGMAMVAARYMEKHGEPCFV